MRLPLTILLVGLLGLLAYLGLAFALQRSVLFPKPGTPRASVTGGRSDLEVAWIGTHGEVESWYLPPHEISGPAAVLIFTHGNGELIDYWVDEFEAPREWGLGVLLVEYPGYGRSGGRPADAQHS